tara:strand:+ start:1901 stop:2362 length:462 start_codon:yes stop_codon:yes gene_type:complete
MAEIKVDCPVCFDTHQCFEDTVEGKVGGEFKSYMCFNCGFTSNSAYKWDSVELKKAQLGATQLMNEVAFYDEDRKIMWFPSIVNMGKLGVIYPEGTKNNWTYKLAQVRQLSDLELTEERYKGHTEILDVENAKEFGQYEFLDACKDMGIVKDL